MPKFSDSQIMPYTADQMYRIVSDVESYPEFLPWCIDCKINDSSKDQFTATMSIGFGPIRQSYESLITTHAGRMINVCSSGGPLSHLNSLWEFEDISQGLSKVKFMVDFSLSSGLLARAIDSVFTRAVYSMGESFTKRAKDIYGS